MHDIDCTKLFITLSFPQSCNNLIPFSLFYGILFYAYLINKKNIQIKKPALHTGNGIFNCIRIIFDLILK